MECGRASIHPPPQNPQLATSRVLPTLALSFGALRGVESSNINSKESPGTYIFITTERVNVHTLKQNLFPIDDSENNSFYTTQGKGNANHCF